MAAPRTSYAQCGQDLLIAYFLDDGPATYVDIGCLWPQNGSNTYYFYERGGRGVCIDANPEVREEFEAARPRDRFVHTGVSNAPGELTYYMHRLPVFNTFDPGVAARLT